MDSFGFSISSSLMTAEIENTPQYHFPIEIATSQEQFELLSSPFIETLKTLITKQIICQSKLSIPLNKYKWSIHFIAGKHMLIHLKSDEQLQELINNTTNTHYPLRILFDNQSEFNGMCFYSPIRNVFP